MTDSPAPLGTVMREDCGNPMNVCYLTGARSIKGVCPVHRGDACLVYLDAFYARAQEDREARFVAESDLTAAREALRDYGEHQSFRCGDRDRWPWEPDCRCGMTVDFRRLGIALPEDGKDG